MQCVFFYHLYVTNHYKQILLIYIRGKIMIQNSFLSSTCFYHLSDSIAILISLTKTKHMTNFAQSIMPWFIIDPMQQLITHWHTFRIIRSMHAKYSCCLSIRNEPIWNRGRAAPMRWNITSERGCKSRFWLNNLKQTGRLNPRMVSTTLSFPVSNPKILYTLKWGRYLSLNYFISNFGLFLDALENR